MKNKEISPDWIYETPFEYHMRNDVKFAIAFIFVCGICVAGIGCLAYLIWSCFK